MEVSKMRNSVYILITAVILFALQNARASYIDNPAIRNPAGIGTVPPSSLRSGLITSPNPMDQTGNSIMTGNIRGGRSFHGGVPYRSSSSFWGGLSTATPPTLLRTGRGSTTIDNFLGGGIDSSSLDSFLRDSAGSEDFGRYSRRYRYTPGMFHSTTNTVSKSWPGQSGVFRPIDSRVTDRAPDTYGVKGLTGQKPLPGSDLPDPMSRLKLKPLTTDELQRIASGQTRVAPRNEPLSARTYREQIDQLRLDILKSRTKEPLPTGRATQKEDLLNLLTLPGDADAKWRPRTDGRLFPVDKIEQPPETLLPAQALREPAVEPKKKGLGTVEEIAFPGRTEQPSLDSFLSQKGHGRLNMLPGAPKDTTTQTTNLEQIRARIAELQKRLSGLAAPDPRELGPKQEETETSKTVEILGKQEEVGRIPAYAEVLGVGADVTAVPPELLPTDPTYTKSRIDRSLDRSGLGTSGVVTKINQLSTEDVSYRAKRIMGYQSHQEYAKARAQLLTANALAYLKQGSYYKAASSFDRASIYSTKDPVLYAGRSLALFAAGEYVSSALFLARAIDASPEYVESDVDIVAMLGDRDKLDTRIVDAEEWLERSCSPELEFLLAYTYYRMDRLQPAKKAIDNARQDIPNSKVVEILKKAIDAALKAPNNK